MINEPIYRKVQRGKTVRYEEIIMPEGNNEIPLNDDRKTMLLHLALAAFETVRQSEKPKSARYCKVNTAIDRILEQIEIYRIEKWPLPKVTRAGKLVDIFNVIIKMEFPEERA